MDRFHRSPSEQDEIDGLFTKDNFSALAQKIYDRENQKPPVHSIDEMIEWAEDRYSNYKDSLNADRYADLLTMLNDAKRWDALINHTGRMNFMGSAGFESTHSTYELCQPTADPAKHHLHFGMEFWSNYKFPADYTDHNGAYCQRLLKAFVDELVSPTQKPVDVS
jgi:hypothetical protein